MSEEEAIVTTIAMIILAGVGLMVAAMMNRRKMREMEHRERLAMIERGLIPSPESDPARFESAAGFGVRPADLGVRYRTAGVLLIGIGLGLAILITFTARAPAIGIGVGGSWAVLGAASLLNYFLINRREEQRSLEARWTQARPQQPPEPPGTPLK